MSGYKPEGATHYSASPGIKGTLWYRRDSANTWLFWWASRGKWAHSTHDDKSAAIALRAVVRDTGANQ